MSSHLWASFPGIYSHFLITPQVNYSSFAVNWVFCTSYHNQPKLGSYKYHVWRVHWYMIRTCGSSGNIRHMKKVLYPLELDLKVFARSPMWVLCTEFGSSAKAVSTCKPRAISQSPRCDSLHHYLTCNNSPSTNGSSHLGNNSKSHWKTSTSKPGDQELRAAE